MPVYRLTCTDRETGDERQCLLWAHDDAKARRRADDKGFRVSSLREATELDLADPICQWIGTPTKAVAPRNPSPSAPPQTVQSKSEPWEPTAVGGKIGVAVAQFVVLFVVCGIPVVLIVLGVAWLRGDFSNSYPTIGATSPSSGGRPSDIPFIGQKGYIWTHGAQYVLGATSQAAYDMMEKATLGNDDETMKALVLSANVSTLLDGTRIQVLGESDRWFGPVQIRLLDGPNAGMDFWVDRTYLRE